MKKRVLISIIISIYLVTLVPDWSAIALVHTHTDDCYFRCQGVDYNKDGVINDSDLEIKITNDGFTTTTSAVCRSCKAAIHVQVVNTYTNQKLDYPHAVDKTKLICDATFTSITPANANQVVYTGSSIDSKATANFSNGTTVNVDCAISGFNAALLSTQTVTLSYTYNGVKKSANITVNLISTAHVHSDACYVRCQGIDYNNDGKIDISDLEYHSIPAANGGGYNLTCRKCGATIFVHTYVGPSSALYEASYPHSLDKTKLMCPQYTIAPTVSITNMDSNTSISKAVSSFPLSIKVYDFENDILTCKYYFDGSSTPVETMTVIGTKPERIVPFPVGFNPSTLSEGTHTIKVTAATNYATVGSATVTFKITSALNVFEYVYDSNGRLIAIKCAGKIIVSYIYDKNGNLISVQSTN